MNWFGRLLNRNRRAARPGRPWVTARSFAAGATDRLTSDWSSTPVSADLAVYQNQKALRARSREQWRNNDYARRFVSMVKANVVGTKGVLFQSRVRDEGPLGGEDRLACDAIEAAWADWGRPPNCDLFRRMSWVDHQRLAIGGVAMDGESFIEIIDPQDQPPYRFALRHIDPDLIPVELNVDLGNGGFVRMGIEYDALGRTVAFFVNDLSRTANPAMSAFGLGSRFRRVPAALMIHAFAPDLVGQSRGLPWMSTALLRLKMLGAYDDAALVAARVGAAKMGLYQTADGEPAGFDSEDSDGTPVDTVEPGTFGWIPKGATLASWSPEYPRGEFEGFVKAMLRGIAAGLGVAYTGLANDLEGVNYSSIRSGVLEERESWKAIQDWTVEAICRPIFERWLERALLLGAIRVPTRGGGTAGLNPDRFDKYRSASWQPRRWAWVDPQSDMTANEKALGLLLTSRAQIIREQGGDPADLWEEIAAENKVLSALGLGTEGSGVDALRPGAPAPGPGDDGEDESGADDAAEDTAETETESAQGGTS
jgi:lambda family phage portal protein